MKNYKRTNSVTKNIFTLLVFGILTTNLGYAAEKIENSQSIDPIESIDYGNSILDRLKGKIEKDGYVFNAHISSTTVKKDKNAEMAFTTFGSGPVHLKKDGRFHINNVETAFNNRNNFQSKKTIESLVLYSSGNQAKITMKFHTWSNQTVELSNVNITKERHGYFITGSQSNNTKTVYYTIVISHNGRLI